MDLSEEKSEKFIGRCKQEPAQGSRAFGDQGGVAGDEAQRGGWWCRWLCRRRRWGRRTRGWGDVIANDRLDPVLPRPASPCHLSPTSLFTSPFFENLISSVKIGNRNRPTRGASTARSCVGSHRVAPSSVHQELPTASSGKSALSAAKIALAFSIAFVALASEASATPP